MKPYKVLIVAVLLVILAFAFRPDLLCQSNDVSLIVTNANDSGTNAPVVVGSQISILLALFKGKAGWLASIITFLGTLRLALAAFSPSIQRWIADKFNSMAAKSGEDVDAKLSSIFNKSWYKSLAFLLLFLSIRLPTINDLERAIKLQREAVVESKNDGE